MWLVIAFVEVPLAAFVIWLAWHEPGLPPSVRAELESIRCGARKSRRAFGVLVIFRRQR